ncbi:unnamed protein product [Allacma fusca]|uniref:Uncharacterized protein n=1 Tax=Allacma fusca TaxID=39272 RepID=A0A8J2NRW1_9HEXA|nr:unnamed protein product [Allacma fusca]
MIVPCILALVKWSVLAQALQDPQPPTWFADKDDPVYKLERPKYVRDMNKSIESDYYRCVHADVFRLKFGKEVGKRDVKSVAVPILWPEFTVSAKIVITSIGSFLPNMTKENPSGHQISVN